MLRLTLIFKKEQKGRLRWYNRYLYFKKLYIKKILNFRGKRERKGIEQFDSKLELEWSRSDRGLFSVVAHHLRELFLGKLPILILVISLEHSVNLKCFFSFYLRVENIFISNEIGFYTKIILYNRYKAYRLIN